jgi:hypothetical protein
MKIPCMDRTFVWVAFLCLAQSVPAALAEDALVPKRGQGTPPPGDSGEGGWMMRIMLATSTNGLDFRREQFVVSDQATTPSVVVDAEGRARIYYLDFGNGGALACATQVETRTLTNWSYRRVHIAGLSRGFRRQPLDPAVVALPGGSYRLYYVHAAPKPKIYSALSTNGFDFVQEEGTRIEHNRDLFAPTLLRVGKEWLLWGGPDPAVVARSSNGIGFSAPQEFRVEGVRFMPWSASALPNNGGYRLYGNFFGAGEWSGGVSSVTSTNGQSWSREPGIRFSLDGSKYPLESRIFADHGCARLPDGRWLMAYVAGIPIPRGR